MESYPHPEADPGETIDSSNSPVVECTARGQGAALSREHLSRSRVLSFESLLELQELAAFYREKFRPADSIEEFYVERLIVDRWRLRRIARIERGLVGGSNEPAADAAPVSGADAEYRESTMRLREALTLDCTAETYGALLRYENSVRRSFAAALRQLRSIQAGRESLRTPKARAARTRTDG